MSVMSVTSPSGGNKVDLSGATVTFTKGVLGYLADGLSVNTPQVEHTACYSTDLYSFCKEIICKTHQFTFDFFVNNGIKWDNVIAYTCSES